MSGYCPGCGFRKCECDEEIERELQQAQSELAALDSSTATSELKEIINRARERGCAEHGHEIKWLLELPMTDEEWKRFNDLTGWSARKR